MRADENRRLFFALWLDDQTRADIQLATRETVRQSGGRAVAVENYHLTLAFLGAQPESRLPAILEAAATLAPPTGELQLVRLGHFKRVGVLWLGPERTPAALSGFVNELWSALAPLGIARERRPYAAHLTLARKVKQAPNVPVRTVTWRYAGFVLAESVPAEQGVCYRIVGEWPAVK